MPAKTSRAKAKAARPTSVAAYLASLAPEKRAVIEEARALVHKHIPKGTRTTASRSVTWRSARRRTTTRST
jgi:hypothetical protein